MKKIKIKTLPFVGALAGVVLSLFLGFFSSPNWTFAQNVISEEDNVVRDISGGATDVRTLGLNIVRFLLTFLGILAVVMIIYAGFLYITAAGNEEKVNQAKKIILYAVIGIVVIAISFAVVNTIFRGISGGTEGT